MKTKDQKSSYASAKGRDEKPKKKKREKQLVDIITPKNEASLIEEVTSKRDVKYIYPEGCTDTLARKKFRQQIRNKVKSYYLKLNKMEEGKDKRKLMREFERFYNSNVKKGADII